jgi:hypothetical protein
MFRIEEQNKEEISIKQEKNMKMVATCSSETSVEF